MKERINQILDSLQDGSPLASKQATIGFDGFIDSIVRAVESKNSGSDTKFFSTIEQFGSHLVSKKGMSCSIELKEEAAKMGGNMPILANALGTLGTRVNCVGSLGLPDIHPEFKKMASGCVLYSISDPGFATAMEFDDGKIMLCRMDAIDTVNWDNVKASLGLDNLIRFFRESDLVGLVNWSELTYSDSVWEGILKEILPHHIQNKQQIAFFDLSDCSRRSDKEILHILQLIGRYSDHYKVILGMNENETRLVFRALDNGRSDLDLADMGNKIFENLKVDVLIVHPVKYALAWDGNGIHRVDGLYVEKPVLSTGGGDNFNAGLCAGQLLGLDIETSLIMASAVSGFYVKYGYSPELHELCEILRYWRDDRST